MKKYIKKLKILYKNIKIPLFGVILLLFYFSYPPLALKIGDAFFGNYKSLYNITFAQFFYKSSISIPFTKIPRYSYYELSRTYFIQGDLFAALENAEKELELYPEDTTTYYILGLTYGYMNRNHDAIDAFSKYLETHPGSWAGRNDKAWLQFRIGDIDGALATIEPITENFRWTSWVMNTYCGLLVAKKDISKAKKICEEARKNIYSMNKDDWGRAYPGNDPKIYESGLEAMKKSVNENITIIQDLEKVHN